MKKVLHWLKQPFVWILIVFVVIGGVALLMFGMNPNIGGVIGRLLGKTKEAQDPLAVANTVPKGRKDEEGNEIPKGVADENGFTQWDVKELEKPKGIFRDKSVVVVKDEQGKKKEIKLPQGVKDTDVDTVIEVKPKEFVVKVKDNSKVKVGDLMDSLP